MRESCRRVMRVMPRGGDDQRITDEDAAIQNITTTAFRERKLKEKQKTQQEPFKNKKKGKRQKRKRKEKTQAAFCLGPRESSFEVVCIGRGGGGELEMVDTFPTAFCCPLCLYLYRLFPLAQNNHKTQQGQPTDFFLFQVAGLHRFFFFFFPLESLPFQFPLQL